MPGRQGAIGSHCQSKRGLRATTRAGVCLLLQCWPCERSLTACQPAALTAVALGEGSDVGGLVWDPSAAQLSTSYSHGPACVPAQPFPALPDSPLSAQQPTLRSHGCQQRVLLSGAQLHQPRLREKTKRWRALGDLVLR